jgi:UDP-2,3-diacylglucosamine pyrophosphatase LpxH
MSNTEPTTKKEKADAKKTEATASHKKLRYRTIWISDVHLGFRGCRADFLIDFLKNTRCDTLYLVGDIIDLWNMKKGLYWPQAHNNVVRAILSKARRKTRVVFVPGNHDELIRDFGDTAFGNIEIRNQSEHELANGKRMLILHGDEFDSVVKFSPFLAKLGSHIYDWLIWANRHINVVRRRMGFPYWSLAGLLKHKVKNAVNYISSFEDAIIKEAQKRGMDGVVCGHIHHAEIRMHGGALYCNCGDWVESHTALVEHQDGRLEIVHWGDSHGTLHHWPADWTKAKPPIGDESNDLLLAPMLR